MWTKALSISCLAVVLGSCSRNVLPNAPTDLKVGTLVGTSTPAQIRPVNRSGACPTTFDLSHRFELRESVGIGLTVIAWTIQIENSSTGASLEYIGDRRFDTAFTQCTPAPNGYVAPGGFTCADVSMCSTSGAAGRSVVHYLSTVDDHNVPSQAIVRIPVVTP